MVLRDWPAALILAGILATAAQAFDLPVRGSAATAASLLAGDAAEWAGAVDCAIELNRTPPLYEGDPVDDGIRPSFHVECLRSAGSLFVRLRWTDPTDSSPRPAEAVPDEGEPHIYQRHSADIDRFADAACIMVPQTRGPHAAMPSLMMGEVGQPVFLYYWDKVRGFERLEAAGRGTTTRGGSPFPGGARRTPDGWNVVFQLPDLPASTPFSFAVWDGDRGQRDGLKYFSVWYELTP